MQPQQVDKGRKEGRDGGMEGRRDGDGGTEMEGWKDGDGDRGVEMEGWRQRDGDGEMETEGRRWRDRHN